MIELAFKKEKADERKQWLLDTLESNFVDHQIKTLTYSDFINKELIHFSISDNKRGIACLIDGFKPSQRKVIFGCFKRNLKSEIKVA